MNRFVMRAETPPIVCPPVALLAVVLACLLCISAARAEPLSYTVTTSSRVIEVSKSGVDESVRLSGVDFSHTTTPGEPALPFRVVNILLPPNEKIAAVEFIAHGEETFRSQTRIKNATPMLSEDGVPASESGRARRSRDGSEFPSVYGRYLSTGYLHGLAVASFAVYPLRVRGSELVLNEAIEIRVQTEPVQVDREIAVRQRHRNGFDARTRHVLSGLVLNPEMGYQYQIGGTVVPEQPGGFAPTSYPSLEGSPVDYLIVTTEDLKDEYQDLADWKTDKGIPTVVRTVEWITANTRNGADIAETIRFFVRDAYARWGITYLLLGGDTDVIPTRYALSRYWPPGGETRIPTDLYFACLDGSWNDTHDLNWGEPYLDNVDMYAEVYHGRIPISDPADVGVMIDRIKRYELAESPSYGNKYLSLAEVLFPEDWSEGKTITLNGAYFSELLYHTKLDTIALDVTRMYQTDDLYPGSIAETKAAVMDSLDSGFNFVFHVGHGYRHIMSVGDESIRSLDADTLSNDQEWFNLYMLNCTAAAFDYFCLGEHFLQNPNGGGVSVIGASETAFPYASAYYMEEYAQLLFQENAVYIGEAFGRSRLPRTPVAVGVDGADAWTHFIYTNLSDPAMQLFTDQARQLSVAHPPTVGLGDTALAFVVMSDGAPVDSAVVCLTKGAEDYATAFTDPAGHVTIDFTTESAGSIGVVVTGLNLARHQSYIEVVPPLSAYINVADVIVDDDNADGTNGNGDGIVDAGETVDFGIELINSGSVAAGGVSLTCSSSDASATLLDDSAFYGHIGASATKSTSDTVRVFFDPAMADETVIEFSLTLMDSNSTTWNDSFKKVVHSPSLERTTIRIDDTAMGDGDGVVGANEPFVLYCELKNYGTGAANGLTATIEDLDGAFIFADSEGTYDDLGPLSAGENTGFSIMETDTTAEHRLRFVVTDSYSRTTVDTIELRPPLPPPALSFDASLGPDQLLVAWAPSILPDVNHYNVYRSLSAPGPFTRVNPDLIEHGVFINTGLLPLTQYFFYVTCVDQSGNESAPSPVFSASTNPPIASGFPIMMPLATPSSPVVGDIDGDGENEILVGNQYVFAWHADGQEIRDGDSDPRSWGAINAEGDEFAAAIALAHIDDSPGLDIVAADLFTMSVFCMDHDGVVLPGWPQFGEKLFRAPPVAGDLDGDGRDEVIAVDASGVVFAWNRDGSEVIDGDADPMTQGVFFRSPFVTTHYHAPALCDIDGDLKDEIIIGTRTGSVYALNGDGSSVAGWPFVMNDEMVGGVVAGYIDGDLFPEIVVRSDSGQVYLLEHDATVAPGWPRVIPYTEAYFRATPALADFDDDGTLDIVLAHHTTVPYESRLYVIDHMGVDRPGWPVVYASVFSESSPVVADVDGDGFLDILMGDEAGAVHGFDRNGSPLAGFPIATGDAIRGTPTVWDTDGDGLEELVIHSWDQNIYVYDLASPHVPGKGWPTDHANARRNGRAGSSVATGVGSGAFSYSVDTGNVTLTWLLSTAGRTAHDVYRALSSENGFQQSDYVTIASGVTVDEDGTLRVRDDRVDAGNWYVYKLTTKDDPRATFLTEPIYVPVDRAALGQNFPNPFNPETEIVYYVPEGPAKNVSLFVYDVTGARVRALVNSLRHPGRFAETWDGRDDAGNSVASGIYFYRFVYGDFSATKKMILLK